MADRSESIILEFSVDLEDSVESISSLTKQSKALREERNKLNIQSDAGKKRAQEINALLDQNTNKIKNNVSAIEQQRSNIGNYKSALDGVHPALGKVSQGLEAGSTGFKAMARSALAFIATPIGAVLAAIVVVFGLLKSALSQNDALMDKFENVTNAVGVVLEIVVARVGKLGEALIALAQGNFSEAINLTGQAFGGLADEIGRAVTQQQLFLDASRTLEDSQRNLRIEIAKQQTVITGLIKESKNRNLSLDEQSAKLIQASKLEADLQRTREDIAFRDLVITSRRLRADKEFQQQSNETFEQYINRLLESSKLGPAELDKIADKVVALEEARNSGLVLQQKIENDLTAIELKRVEALKKQTEALAEQAAQEAANRRAASKDPTQSTVDPLQGAFDTQLNKEQEVEITERFNDRIVKSNAEADAETARNHQRSIEGQLALDKRVNETKLQLVQGFLGAAASLFDEQSAEYKAFATFETIISTYAAAQKAFESQAGIPYVGPALGAAAAALAIVQGLANVAAIHGVQFAEGGWTGPGGKYQARGVVHADEYVTPKWLVHSRQAQPHLSALETMRQRGYADGGLVVNGITQPINQSIELSNIFKNMAPAEVSVVEIAKVDRRVKVKQRLSKR